MGVWLPVVRPFSAPHQRAVLSVYLSTAFVAAERPFRQQRDKAVAQCSGRRKYCKLTEHGISCVQNCKDIIAFCSPPSPLSAMLTRNISCAQRQGGGGQCRYNVLHVLAAAPLAYWQYFLHQQNQVFIFFTNQVFIFPTRPTTITTTTECKMFTSSCVIHTPLSSTPHVQFVVLVRSSDGRISRHECI